MQCSKSAPARVGGGVPLDPPGQPAGGGVRGGGFSRNPSGVSWETFFTFGAAAVYGEDTIEDERAAYSTSGISKSFLVKNSTRPVATAAGFLPGKSWLAHGIDTVSIFGIHCCSSSATSKNTGNVSLPRIDSTGCRISFRPSVVIFQRCMAPSST